MKKNSPIFYKFSTGKGLLLLFLLGLTGGLHAQTRSFQWAHRMGSSDYYTFARGQDLDL